MFSAYRYFFFSLQSIDAQRTRQCFIYYYCFFFTPRVKLSKFSYSIFLFSLAYVHQEQCSIVIVKEFYKSVQYFGRLFDANKQTNKKSFLILILVYTKVRFGNIFQVIQYLIDLQINNYVCVVVTLWPLTPGNKASQAKLFICIFSPEQTQWLSTSQLNKAGGLSGLPQMIVSRLLFCLLYKNILKHNVGTSSVETASVQKIKRRK